MHCVYIIQMRTKCKVFRKGSFQLMSGLFYIELSWWIPGRDGKELWGSSCLQQNNALLLLSFFWNLKILAHTFKKKKKIPVYLIFPIVVVTNSASCPAVTTCPEDGGVVGSPLLLLSHGQGWGSVGVGISWVTWQEHLQFSVLIVLWNHSTFLSPEHNQCDWSLARGVSLLWNDGRSVGRWMFRWGEDGQEEQLNVPTASISSELTETSALI